ncbi:MAG: zinc ribbon domain-containing protein [Thermoproteota archaeon]|nr:MAG: zinc ribbon domain-containing protein [Candidatus Korarchaeota archaeon]
MPTYEFRCNACNHKFELFISMNERDKVRCPKCGSPDVTQLLTGCYIKGTSSTCASCTQTTCSTCPLISKTNN